jgi:exportin-2 (importin alpha re-exporter)
VRDIEGEDSESRTRCSQELLRSMCRQFEPETTKICSEHINTMLAEYATDPVKKWTAKDAAVSSKWLLKSVPLRFSFG